MKTSVVPSNQNSNSYSGLPGVSESKWARAVSDWVVKTLRDHGHEAEIFWEESADQIGALKRMVNAAIAAKPDAVLSIHSDAVGDTAQTGVLTLVTDNSSVGWGTVFARDCGQRLGMPFRGVWVFGVEARRIIFLSRLRETNTRGLLAEIGEHATVIEAGWNWRHIKEIGVGIAEAWLVSLGITLEDDMTKAEVEAIVRGMMDTVHVKAEVIEEAQAKLVAADILSAPRVPGQLMSNDLSLLLFSRVLAATSGVDLSKYEIRLVPKE